MARDPTSESIRIGESDIPGLTVKRINNAIQQWRRPRPKGPNLVGIVGENEQPNTALDRLSKEINSGTQAGATFAKFLVDHFDEMRILFNGDEWMIMPITIETILDKYGFKHILVHQGYIYGPRGEYDNLKNLEIDGVWGAQEKKPTYVAPLDDLGTTPNFVFPEDEKDMIPVTLYIDPAELASRRALFADPEVIEAWLQNGSSNKSQMPNAFYANGGIPAESIIAIHSGAPDKNLF